MRNLPPVNIRRRVDLLGFAARDNLRGAGFVTAILARTRTVTTSVGRAGSQ
jgi:hypothetical protein